MTRWPCTDNRPPPSPSSPILSSPFSYATPNFLLKLYNCTIEFTNPAATYPFSLRSPASPASSNTNTIEFSVLTSTPSTASTAASPSSPRHLQHPMPMHALSSTPSASSAGVFFPEGCSSYLRRPKLFTRRPTTYPPYDLGSNTLSLCTSEANPNPPRGTLQTILSGCHHRTAPTNCIGPSFVLSRSLRRRRRAAFGQVMRPYTPSSP
jgi:hypothetical protein